MVERFPNRPRFIIESFTDNTISREELNLQKGNAIMYAGASFEEYGIVIPLKAFTKIKGDYELWLFGNSDIIEMITKYSDLDPRVKCVGVRPNREINEF